MTDSIHIDSCDNEMIFIAYNSKVSYQIARVISGYNNSVGVTIDLNPGIYQGSFPINGLSGAISGQYELTLPKGKYKLQALGINWGGPSAYKFSFNGNSYSGGQTGANGYEWSSAPISFSV